ncbi:MAG: quaternary ammonium compound efflux SMR transporter SugE [Verrucomicrobiota bacterium]
MAWLFLTLAGVLEIVWLISMKYTNGFTKLWPSLVTVAAMCGSMWLVSLSLKTIPAGTAYAVWTGIGAAGGAIAGIVLFGESREFLRLGSIALIVLGIVGLKLTSSP